MAQLFVSGMAHFFVVVSGSKIHERVAHFFIDIYTQKRIIYLFPRWNLRGLITWRRLFGRKGMNILVTPCPAILQNGNWFISFLRPNFGRRKYNRPFFGRLVFHRRTNFVRFPLLVPDFKGVKFDPFKPVRGYIFADSSASIFR